MCFSAGASFGAAAILGIGGIISLKKVTRRSEIMFASIPLLFSVQQAVEGTLWIVLCKGSSPNLKVVITYIFLFFAQMLWSSWIPMSMLLLESDNNRKKLLKAISVLGIFCSFVLGYRLITYDIYAEIRGHHIYYGIQSPQWMISFSGVLYIIATVLPSFVLGIKRMKLLGILLTLSLLFSKIFYSEYLISVWCFFAAFLSVIIILIMNDLQKNQLIVTKT